MPASLEKYFLVSMTLVVLVTYAEAKNACGIKNCELCGEINGTDCNKCPSIHDLPRVSECKPPECNYDDCVQCYEVGLRECRQCETGFIETRWGCEKGPCLKEGCDSCGLNGECEFCAEGYLMEGSVCVRSSGKRDKCTKCDTKGACTECQEDNNANKAGNRVLSGNGAVLVKCTVAAVVGLSATAVVYVL